MENKGIYFQRNNSFLFLKTLKHKSSFINYNRTTGFKNLTKAPFIIYFKFNIVRWDKTMRLKTFINFVFLFFLIEFPILKQKLLIFSIGRIRKPNLIYFFEYWVIWLMIRIFNPKELVGRAIIYVFCVFFKNKIALNNNTCGFEDF